MNMVLQNTAYRVVVRADNGRVLTGQRTYLSQGVTRKGKKWFKDMRWFAFQWGADGKHYNFEGIAPEFNSKSELINAIKQHTLFTQARKEL